MGGISKICDLKLNDVRFYREIEGKFPFLFHLSAYFPHFNFFDITKNLQRGGGGEQYFSRLNF